MNKIQTNVVVKEFDEQVVLTIKVNSLSARDLCLQLLLLREKLIESLELSFQNFLIVVSLSINENSCKKLNIHQKVGTFSISVKTLEYWIYFLLKYYRDGKAEARHIDVDFVSSNGVEITITSQVDEYFEYADGEYKKMLDL